ncbi:hypothetical protein UO65_4665 [Actinokineospora spheciospongiae]|uniref:Uncharacterized protein n=1 Tax=Actinokineospora spheciospongiae TaxID=909613 RepID=W7IUH6_9PSEU|nr:hypothetical protein UO65_4665 [Actinokineospora spheciospongiae]
MTLLSNALISLGVVLVVMVAAFGVSLARGRYDTVDTVWGLGFAVVAVVTCALSTGDLALRLVTTALTVVWGVRLAVHLHVRNRGKPEDRRYAEIAGRAKGDPRWHVFVRVFLVQAAVMWFVSLPVQAAQYADSFGVLAWVGVAVWLVGFTFETVGDHQLSAFANDPSTGGKVLDTGLWRYTRHPNYFGDAAVWWGLYLLACASWPGAATVLSPIAMTFTLAKGTGKPMTEKHLSSSRPGYADYVARTSGFFPLPPKERGALR